MNASSGEVETATDMARAITRIFNTLFSESEGTVLVGGAQEPLYTPSADLRPAQIHFRHDYASSALHEVAHWCIAGPRRRTCVDYGYWYAPDGRSAEEQHRFVQVEARPQALEWLFSLACGIPFRVSIDNLDAPPDARAERALREAVLREARQFLHGALPARAARFYDALREEFTPGLELTSSHFSKAALR